MSFFWSYNKFLRPEFFPIRLSYISVKIFWFWKWICAWNLLWFTAVNPWFPLGGLYPSSKRDILQQLEAKYIPKTSLITQDDFTVAWIKKNIARDWIGFPMIIKPDNGLRGLGIEVFHTKEELDDWLQSYIDQHSIRGARLVQEFIEDPEEFGVFYVRIPWETRWTVTGIVAKEFLEIVWNGVDTFEKLVHMHPRARYHIWLLQEQFSLRWNEIIPLWEHIEIVEIWTHSRWSTFIDASENITQDLITIIDSVAKHVDWFYYGRFDVRTKNMQTLTQGDFKVMEINPTYGEPTWMYDPEYSFIQQQKILIQHWKIAYKIARANHRLGVPYASISEWRAASKEYNLLVL